METSQPQRTFDARDYLRIMQKRKWFILIVALTAMVSGGIYAQVYPKRFRATAWVVVYPEPQSFFWGPGQRPREQGRQMSLETQAALAGSNEVAALAATRLQARSAQQVIADPADIAGSISARAIPPDRIRIQATHQSRLYAISFANQTAQSFVELSTEYRRKEDSAAVQFLEKQLVSTEGELQKALDDKQTKQKQWGIVSPDASQAAAGTLYNYQTALEQAQMELSITESHIVSLQEQLAELYESPVSEQPIANSYRDSLEAQLETARITLAQLRTRYIDNYPAVQQVQLQVEELSKQISEEPAFIRHKQVVNEARLAELSEQIRTSKTQAATLHARISVLQNLISKTQATAINLLEKQNLLARDAYEVGLYQQTYEALLQELQDRRLQKAAKQGTADVLDHALRATPMEVNVWRSILFTGMLGLVGGIAFALLMEMLDTAIYTPDDILYDTEVDFLGVIPLAESEQAQLVTLAAPRSPPTEAYRTLRSNINFAILDRPAQKFLITSAGSGEGKSVVTANLGLVFAQAGESVIVVDSDLRRPNLYRLFTLDSTPGLTSVLMGETAIEDALQETEVENLRVLTSGPLPPNPAELLDSSHMDDFIEDVVNYADIVLFDSPPAIMLADAIILSAKLDTTILVVESGQVTREALSETVRLINRAHGDILGVILNKMDISRSGYYYYYYYYYYDYTRPTPEEAAIAERAQADQPPLTSPFQSPESD